LVYQKYGYTKNVIRPVAWRIELYTVSCIPTCRHETLILAANKVVGSVVVCNFNLYLLAAGTPRDAVAIRQFEALSYSLKRSADINLLTSWLEMKLGGKCRCGRDAILADEWQTSPASPQIKAYLGSS
jgi:hypothetical protein